jgi:hypothetical protein
MLHYYIKHKRLSGTLTFSHFTKGRKNPEMKLKKNGNAAPCSDTYYRPSLVKVLKFNNYSNIDWKSKTFMISFIIINSLSVSLDSARLR